MKSYELSWADRSKIFSDTLQTLRSLKEKGCKMGLITNTSLDAANRMLSKYEIKTFFEIIVTREDVKKLKPNPEGILLALKRLDERKFYFIGSTIRRNGGNQRWIDGKR